MLGSVLTLVGIYGVISLSVASRRREFAIRSAVGAQQNDIRKLIFGEGFRLIAGGVLAGIVLAIILSRVLRTFLFEVQPSDPMTFIVVGSLFIAVGLLACWAPAGAREKSILWMRCATNKSWQPRQRSGTHTTPNHGGWERRGMSPMRFSFLRPMKLHSSLAACDGRRWAHGGEYGVR